MPHLWTLTSRCIIPSECFYPRLVSFFFFTLLTFRYTFDDCGWKAPQFQLTKLYILLYIVFSGHSITSTDVGSFHIVKDHQTKQTRERCDITTDGSLVRAVGTVHFAVADLIRSQAHGCVVCTRVLGRLADGRTRRTLRPERSSQSMSPSHTQLFVMHLPVETHGDLFKLLNKLCLICFLI